MSKFKKGISKVKSGAKKIKEKNKSKLFIFLVSLGIIIALVILIFGLYIIISAPDFNQTKLYNKEASVIYDKDGKEIARVGSENRVLVTYDDLPEVFVDALVATEDSRFFQHNGFDAARFLKASISQALGKNAGGASTLTMQVVKNTYTGGEVSIVRKFTDIYMAVFKIEKVYTKEEIIEFYVNSLWMGYGGANYDSINGVEQASQTYFGKSVNDLSLPEAALLVGMFNNPVYYNPVKNPENAKARQKTVLSLMVKHGYITEEEAENAADIPIESLLKSSTSEESTDTSGMQEFIEYVIDDVIEKTGDDPTKTAMAIYTTLDSSIQDVITSLENGELYTFTDDLVQNGIAVTSTVDGSILALGAGRNYVKTGTNRATDIKRQPGSTAKPIFDYGPYIEYNNGSTGSLFFDEVYTYSTGTAITNYDNKYKGMITMRDALIDSRNIPALQAFQAVDKDKIAEFAHSLGIDYGDNLYESASIGGFDGVSPLQMSAAYAAFGRGGYYIEPYSFTKIVYLDTNKEYNYKYTKTRVMSEETAYMITDMLVDGGASGVGGSIKVSGTEVAAKGGTTTIDSTAAKQLGIPSYATPDHWNNVYTADYSISLWYGYDDYYSSGGKYITSSTGGTARRKIMATVANKILKTNSKFTKPSGVVEVTIEFGTFPLQLASENTPDSLKRTELFKKGTEPTDVSTRFSKLETPTNGKAIVNGSSITLTWNAIATPDAIDDTKLQNYFNEYYKTWAQKYYQERVSYNASYIGSLGYQVYLENSDGSLTSLGFTPSTSFNYTASSASNYKFVIKASYSIFKSNMSNGLTITANLADTKKEDTTTQANTTTENTTNEDE
jgi:penicillin-binding protein 1A